MRFLTFALLADFALFVPFFVRTEVRRFAFLSFLAMFNLQISQSKLCQQGTKPQTNLCTTVVIASLEASCASVCSGPAI